MLNLILHFLRKIVLLFLLFALMCLNTQNSWAKEGRSITVLRSRIIRQYNEAFTGFSRQIKEAGFDIKFNDYNIQEYQNDIESLVINIKNENPDLILCIGTEAALFAKKKLKEFPKVFTMVLDPVESGITQSVTLPEENMTGVVLKISLKYQFEKILSVIPKVRRIGMLYDAQHKKSLRAEAELAAKSLGLELIAKPVSTKSEVDKKLKELVKEADCLWAAVDTLIYNPQSAQHILLTTLRYKLPFMAFSSHYVKAGALMALVCDYYDIGEQTGVLAKKILMGQSPMALPIERPRTTKLITNNNTAEILKINLYSK